VVRTKLCANCRYWSDSDGILLAGTAEFLGLCRRQPPQLVASNEHLKIAHDANNSEIRPYVPDRAWQPLHLFPCTPPTEWCGEWAYPELEDRRRADDLARLKSSS